MILYNILIFSEEKGEVLSYIDYIKSKSRRKSEKAEFDSLYTPAIDEIDITHIEDDSTHHDDHIHQSKDLKEDFESKVVIDFPDLEQSQPKSTVVAPKISSKVKVSAEYKVYFSMWFGAAK